MGCCGSKETNAGSSFTASMISTVSRRARSCCCCEPTEVRPLLNNESASTSSLTITDKGATSYSGTTSSYNDGTTCTSNYVQADGPIGAARSDGHGLDDSGKRHNVSSSDVYTQRGKDLHSAIKEAYRWKDRYGSPTSDFLTEMDKLFMDCQVHLSDLSNRSSTSASARNEVDYLVQELIALRNHWGRKMLPMSVCNAFVRERIVLSISLHRYRIDCAEFFEPVPFNESSPTPGDHVKLYRFSVYDLSKNEVIIRYFLERTKETIYNHVLSYSKGSDKGQVQVYGSMCPNYWEVRRSIMKRIESDIKR